MHWSGYRKELEVQLFLNALLAHMDKPESITCL